MVTRWYPSKVDWWVGIALAVTPLTCVAVLVATLVAGEGEVVAVGTCVFVAALYLLLVFPMRYGMDDEHLVVRHGVVRQRIPLRDITKVAPTRNPLSSPALSLDRLEITFGEGFFKRAMISPAAKDDFLAELARRASLRRDGAHLVR